LTKIPISQPNSGSGTMNLADLGLSTSDTIKVEHQFTFNIGDKWEKPLRKVAETLVTAGFHWAESFRIIAMGLSAYFVLAGLARLVEATKSTGDPPSSSKSRSSQSSSSSSRSKSGSTKEKEKSSSSSKNSSKDTQSEHGDKGNDSLQASS